MNESWTVGFLCGLIVVVVLFKMLVKRLKLTTDGNTRTKYDERQLIERGKGYRCGFFAYVIYNCIFLILDLTLNIKLMQTGVLLICGILVACAAHVIYCIFHEAYWGLNNNVRNYIIILIIAAAANLGIGIGNLFTEDAVVDGMLTYRAVNLIVAIFVIVILAALLIKWFRDKREVE